MTRTTRTVALLIALLVVALAGTRLAEAAPPDAPDSAAIEATIHQAGLESPVISASAEDLRALLLAPYNDPHRVLPAATGDPVEHVVSPACQGRTVGQERRARHARGADEAPPHVPVDSRAARGPHLTRPVDRGSAS